MYFCRVIGQKHQKACRRKAETGSEIQIHDNANAILSPSERDQRSPKRNESGYIYQESKTLADELTSSSAHLNSNVEGLLQIVIFFGTISCAVNIYIYSLRLKEFIFWSF